MPANHVQLLAACLAMVLLVLVVGGAMLATRVAEMRRKRIHPQALASSSTMSAQLENVQVADNFRNLFEVPVLFYAGVLAALALHVRSDALLALAWAFVAARYAHAIVHLGYNRVMHRFYAYLAGLLAVLAFWAVLAWLASRA